MEEKLISFETAKLAQEKGFDIMVNHYFADNGREEHFRSKYKANYNCSVSVGLTNSRPTQSLLQKWLREVHNLHLYIDTTSSFGQMESHKSKYKVSVKVPFQPFKWTTGKYYLGDNYEEALEKGLQEALKLINLSE